MLGKHEFLLTLLIRNTEAFIAQTMQQHNYTRNRNLYQPYKKAAIVCFPSSHSIIRSKSFFKCLKQAASS